MKILKFLFLVTTLCFTQLAFAKKIGRVTKLRGKIFRSNVETEVVREPLSVGVWIQEGDIIESEKASFIKVLMKDDTIFSIGPASKFAFEQFKMKTKNERTATYNLLKGKLRSVFTKKAPTRSLHIKTPTASMGVRGTEIVSDVYRVKGQLKTDIALIHGKLEVTTKLGKKFDLKPAEIFEAVDSNRLSQRAAKALKGRTTASDNFKASKRKLKKQVFEVLKKKPRKGGKVFLFDALHEGRKSGKGAEFHDLTEDNKVKLNLSRKEKDRMSIFDEKEGKRKVEDSEGVIKIRKKQDGENTTEVEGRTGSLKGSSQDNFDFKPQVLSGSEQLDGAAGVEGRKEFFKGATDRGPASQGNQSGSIIKMGDKFEKDFKAPDIEVQAVKPDRPVEVERRTISIDQNQIKNRIQKQVNDPNIKLKMQQTIKNTMKRQVVNDRLQQATGNRLPASNNNQLRDQMERLKQLELQKQRQLEEQRKLEELKRLQNTSTGTLDPIN